MVEIKSYNELLNIASEAKTIGNAAFTNFFPNPTVQEGWIEKKSLSFHISGNVTFLIHNKNKFIELFFLAPSFEEMTKALSEVVVGVPRPIIVEIITKKNLMYDTMGEYPLHNVLRRMTRLGLPPQRNISSDIVYANINDKDEIQNIFQSEFDPMSERIPDEEELQRMILSRSIILCRINNKIVGFAVYELTRMSIHLRYWWVDKCYRGHGIGGNLLAAFFREGEDTRRQYLWVFEDNENAIKRYIHYGFKFDGMSDYIFIIK